MFSLLHAPPLEESPLSLLVPPSAEDGTVLSENWPNTHQCVGTLSAPAPGLFTGSASHENIAGDPHSPAHVPSWLSTSPGRSPRPKHSHDLFLHLPDFHVPPDAHPSATEPFVGIPVTWRRALPTTAELPPATWDGQGALHLLLGAIPTWESALTSWHSLSLKKGYWNLYDLLLRHLQAKWPKWKTAQARERWEALMKVKPATLTSAALAPCARPAYEYPMLSVLADDVLAELTAWCVEWVCRENNSILDPLRAYDEYCFWILRAGIPYTRKQRPALQTLWETML